MIQSRLSVLMAERGLKISDLYEETGISKTTLMAIAENTGKGVQFDTVDKLCNFLGVTPCEFFDYSPYIVETKKSNFSEGEIDGFEIKIKKQHYEKYFNLDMFVYSGDSNVIPLKKGEFDYYIPLVLQGSDHYTENEFYTFLSNMSISFRTEFINKLITKVKSQLKDLVINKQSFELIGGYTTIQFQLNDYIALKLFPDSEFETLKKFRIK
ncbi:XRE family transcriptional regulator [Staphylococcus haemolyticus]|uniref:XRE family transcriptional regulator n=2 Tax=Staphylococcus haemolyticus TaxID=1283 RepID=A0A2K0A6T4_STAHA|nr:MULTISPECIES: helix-turn-helix transcriptional regulator [Staphylococcus]PTF45048.1 XRE family transcriptional regulator [Staphylococcus cohnii]MBE7341655.1 helix-turn-helix transcriptional regulator [Staphylococcus haemolyticus]MCH4453310.1 helix-turn-helix transcriptional regulator [Staphylococcus haemolyticus]MDK8538537.1 helix-turn-helix transcriptional regulator [Staphylococcus haemolyticus]OFL86725.1 transcriptional regulator [Staphylococcus sp. HMSC069D12]